MICAKITTNITQYELDRTTQQCALPYFSTNFDRESDFALVSGLGGGRHA
jgi:hypothetical protein